MRFSSNWKCNVRFFKLMSCTSVTMINVINVPYIPMINPLHRTTWYTLQRQQSFQIIRGRFCPVFPPVFNRGETEKTSPFYRNDSHVPTSQMITHTQNVGAACDASTWRRTPRGFLQRPVWRVKGRLIAARRSGPVSRVGREHTRVRGLYRYKKCFVWPTTDSYRLPLLILCMKEPSM